MKRGVTQQESIWSTGEGPLKSFLGAENAVAVDLDSDKGSDNDDKLKDLDVGDD